MSERPDSGAGPTIAIVGAGVSGVVTAARLLAARGPGRVVTINRSGPTARGVAYGTRTAGHVLNVPAGRMSAFPEDEDDFLRFAAERSPGGHAGAFVPRSLYGRYLDFVLVRAAAASTGMRLDRMVGEVVRLERAGANQRLIFADGRRLEANTVVLAVGNYPPLTPAFVTPELAVSGAYVGDPWAPGALETIGRGERVLMIGTGLTMLDVAIAVGGRAGGMVALSRRGIVSAAHRDPGRAPAGDHLPAALLTGPATAVDYLRAVRRRIREEAAQGGDWRDVVGALRPATPALWHQLDDRERGRFLRHLRPFWDAHRHRAAPEAGRALDEWRRSGALEVVAGTVLGVERSGAELLVRVRRRRGGEALYRCDRLVNCTGPASDIAAVSDPLLSDLLGTSRLLPDPWRLGIQTTANYEVLDRWGQPVRRLYYVGPLLRAQHWEATAVPELRVHARDVARVVAAQAGL